MPRHSQSVEQDEQDHVLSCCQATQAERPDSLTQSKPNLRMVLLHSAQHF